VERQGPHHRVGVRGGWLLTAGKLSEEDFIGIEKNACPSVGACGGMYTANTMSSSFEALGMSLLGSSQMAAPDAEKARFRARVGARAGRGDQEGPQAARHHHAQVDRETRSRW
jgi:dihydroxyacid dehydratase/phosphogluconate dehydratase